MHEQKFDSIKRASVRQKFLKLWERETNRTELSKLLHEVVPKFRIFFFFFLGGGGPENSVPFVYLYSEFIDREEKS